MTVTRRERGRQQRCRGIQTALSCANDMRGLLLWLGVAATLTAPPPVAPSPAWGTPLVQRGDVRFPASASQPQRTVAVDVGVAGLGATLRRHLPAQPGGNSALSPLSVAVVLAALQVGARGATAQQIGDLLGQQPGAAQAFWAQLGGALRAVNASTDVVAQVATALFVDASFPLSEGYRQNVYSTLSSEEYAVDFAGHKGSAVDAVNNWVSGATRGRIARILDDVDSSAALVVAAAVYFNGAWQSPFPIKQTTVDNFYVSANEMRPVFLMMNTAQVPFRYSAQYRCKVLGLPYKGGSFSMFLLLPDEPGVEGLQRLEAALTPQSLLQLVASAELDDDVIYAVPRFTLESSFSLKESLQSSGVTALFDARQANLSGLVEDGKPARGLSVSDVVHRVRVEVTETGTEAVSATAAWVSRTTHPVFRADRPFAFVIQHLPTRALLFWGSVVRP